MADEAGHGPQKPRMSTRTMLATAVGGVVAAALIFAVVAKVASSNPTGGDGSEGRDSGGDSVFEVGRAGELADSVARHGPLLFQDPLGGDLAIFVQHVEGNIWRAFESRAPGAPVRCQLTWRAATQDFLDKCSNRTYPSDGTGLVSFPTRVDDDGRLKVDLRSPIPPTTTSTTPPPAADPDSG